MIAIVVACDKNGVIGANGTIPWVIPDDLKLFKKTTANSIVIMGRKTWESIPPKYKPLPDRVNIVVSTTMNTVDGCLILPTLKDAIRFGSFLNKQGETNKPIFIIGGERLYKEALDKKYASRLYVSHIKKEYTGDTYFRFNTQEWEATQQTDYPEFSHVIYKRK